MDHQDWEPIYLKAKQILNKKELEALNQENQLKNARSEIHSKVNKMEKQIEEGNFTHKKMDAFYGKELQKKRLSMGMTQKDIAQKINVPVKMINEIESGKAKHNGQLMNKLNRILTK